MRRTARGCIYVSAFIILVSASSVHADEGEPYTYTSYTAIGGSASSVSGIGVSIGIHLPDPVFLRVTGGAQTIDKKTVYSLGGEVQYDLSKGRFARFYVVGGAGVYHWTGSDYTAFGAGIGGEVALGYKMVNHLSVGGDLFPMVFYDNGTSSEVHPGVSAYFAFNF